MQVTSTSPFSLNATIRDIPTSQKGLESLTHADLVAIVIDQQQRLCSERFSKDNLTGDCKSTAEKVNSFVQGTLLEKLEESLKTLKEKKDFATGEQRRLFQNCQLEASHILDEAKRLKDESVREQKGSEEEDKLLSLIHELPVRMLSAEAQFKKSENESHVISRTAAFQVELAQSRAALHEIMKQAKPEFEKLAENNLVGEFEAVKKKVVIFEGLITTSIKDLEARVSELVDPAKKKLHLKAVLLNNKTSEATLKNQISADLSRVKREFQGHISELNAAKASLKKAAGLYADEVNLYLSGIERKSFTTSSFPTFLGGTTTKQFVSL